MANYTTHYNLVLPGYGESNYEQDYDTGMYLTDLQMYVSSTIANQITSSNGLLYNPGNNSIEGVNISNIIKSPVAGVGATSVQTINSTSYVDITGSSVSYTPPSGATKVIYVYSCHVATSTSGANPFMINLLLDGSSQTGCKEDFYVVDYASKPIFLFYVLNAWTGAKTMKLQTRMHAAGFNMKLNETYRFNGSISSVSVNSHYMVFSL